MNFSEALEHIKSGSKLRRTDWTDETKRIELVRTVVLVSCDDMDEWPYFAPCTDFLADDWEVVESN